MASPLQVREGMWGPEPVVFKMFDTAKRADASAKLWQELKAYSTLKDLQVASLL